MTNLWKFLCSERAPEVMEQLRLMIRDLAAVLK
jgi:hypothetical protein